jgi:protein tyrosine phosphatase (PTP) superfamily phosphohydrolase (DUF442 family)
MHAKIHNYVPMTDRIATSGQPLPEQFTAIAKAGYRSVINLAMPDSDRAVRDEGWIVSRLGLYYFHIPVPFAAPRPEHVRLFCGLLQSLEALPDHRVWVHCILNYRVSAFVYHYLSKVQGLTEAEARSSMFQSWQPDEVWSDLLAWDRERIGV